jgi:hypothetical protein
VAAVASLALPASFAASASSSEAAHDVPVV